MHREAGSSPKSPLFGLASDVSALAMPIAELPENTELIYANWVRLNGTLLDLSFDFGYTEEAFSGPPEKYPARIVMSWDSQGLPQVPTASTAWSFLTC
jgi:hypothetical protein